MNGDESWRQVLRFWFEDATKDIDGLEARKGVWFSSDPAFDQEIRARFESMVLAAERGALDAWLEAPRSALALVILLDQFPRNLYRGTADAFRFDSLAQSACLGSLERGFDQELHAIERAFLLMPLEHSEDLDLQNRSVALQEDLARSVERDLRETCEEFASYARQHRDIVREFGRFPHRNAVLGRTPTAAERHYLDEGGAVFGQDGSGETGDEG